MFNVACELSQPMGKTEYSSTSENRTNSVSQVRKKETFTLECVFSPEMTPESFSLMHMSIPIKRDKLKLMASCLISLATNRSTLAPKGSNF